MPHIIQRSTFKDTLNDILHVLGKVQIGRIGIPKQIRREIFSLFVYFVVQIFASFAFFAATAQSGIAVRREASEVLALSYAPPRM